MPQGKRSVLITGCSKGGMGEALAREFYAQGFEVYATARDIKTMKELAKLGIRTFSLDIGSEHSIRNCIGQLSSLDILVNNAGVKHAMPVTDISISEAKHIFDVNVWWQLRMIHACLPLLRQSKNAVIVNHTSLGTTFAIPFQSTYNASKAALAMFSDTLRLELQPFDIKVVELKSGDVDTNMLTNLRKRKAVLPDTSIYKQAQTLTERSLGREGFDDRGILASVWAKEVVADLRRKRPPRYIYQGHGAWLGRVSRRVPSGSFDRMVKKLTYLDEIGTIIRQRRRSGDL